MPYFCVMTWKQDGWDFVYTSPQTGEVMRIPAYGFGAHCPLADTHPYARIDAREHCRAQRQRKNRYVRRYGGIDVYKGKSVAVSFDVYELN